MPESKSLSEGLDLERRSFQLGVPNALTARTYARRHAYQRVQDL